MSLKIKKSVEDLYQLEHYRFSLLRLTQTSKEYDIRVLKEITFISQSLKTLRQFISVDKEKVFIGWNMSEHNDDDYIYLYSFSSSAVIKRIFNFEKTHDWDYCNLTSLSKDRVSVPGEDLTVIRNNKTYKNPYKGWYFIEYNAYIERQFSKILNIFKDGLEPITFMKKEDFNTH